MNLPELKKLPTQELVDSLTAEIDELKAQIDLLLSGDWTPEQYHKIIATKHITERDADVAKAAYLHCLDIYGGSIHPDYHGVVSERYANQLRQQASK